MKRWLVALCPDQGAPDPHVFTMSVPADTSGGPWRPIPCWVPGSSCSDGHALVPAEAQHLRPLLAVALDGRPDTGPLIAPWDGGFSRTSDYPMSSPSRVSTVDTAGGYQR